MRARPLLFIVVLGLSLVGCRAVREAPPGTPAPSPSAQPALQGQVRYQVSAAESEVRVLVYRDGPMARLGHNHVLSSRALQGEILLGGRDEAPRFALALPVASFTVDDAALRAEEGDEFPGVVDAEAIAGTRRNLLSEALLDGARFPEIRLTSRQVTGRSPGYAVTVAVEVKGQVREVVVPVRVELLGSELRVMGEFSLVHADLGLTPFTVMGGLLSVRDELRLRVRLVART